MTSRSYATYSLYGLRRTTTHRQPSIFTRLYLRVSHLQSYIQLPSYEYTPAALVQAAILQNRGRLQSSRGPQSAERRVRSAEKYAVQSRTVRFSHRFWCSDERRCNGSTLRLRLATPRRCGLETTHCRHRDDFTRPRDSKQFAARTRVACLRPCLHLYSSFLQRECCVYTRIRRTGGPVSTALPTWVQIT